MRAGKRTISTYRMNATSTREAAYAHMSCCKTSLWKLIASTVGAIVFFAMLVTSPAFSQSNAEPVGRDAMWGHQTPSTYKILPRPATGLHSHKSAHTQVDALPKLESAPIKPYAYGWFGTKPTYHWYRQFGHQNSYTQWSLR